ncbi:MerR family transcriptional regulator [Nonomuraea turcica]|uniref:MerR family transcriptional regulator n=1 Tax=Nonomuraea sp. G32 TaxID=3067274 RepID=UPI00273AAFF0|nr:MerR family transcriptional regulator [Nonomuraea sp. G32]MDP4503783.1 MerR family transcriptional regulator [Nonomuraea sp. G32]
MSRHDGDERRWTIGELAKATGVTIRTLYHYEEIGLVEASERTAAGHRRYTEADLRRLYRVRALRGLGLSLDEITEVLKEPSDDLTALRGLLGAQLAEIELQAARLVQLKGQIGGLIQVLDESVMPEAEQFMATLETISVYEAYVNRELRDHLARRRADLGEDRMKDLRAEWLELLRETLGHLRAGRPVGDPAVQELSVRWESLASGLQSGDQQVDERLSAAGMALWSDNSAAISEGVAMQIDWLEAGDLPAVIDYLQRAKTFRSGE